MVEAVVSNGDTEGGYELIHQMQAEPQSGSHTQTSNNTISTSAYHFGSRV